MSTPPGAGQYMAFALPKRWTLITKARRTRSVSCT